MLLVTIKYINTFN